MKIMPRNRGTIPSLIAAFVLIVLTEELVCRETFFARRTTDPYIGLIFQPGQQVIGRTEGSSVSNWTDHGIRRDSLPAEKSPAPILVLGDSFTEALQVNDSEVYTAQLEARLSDGGVSIPVLNAGASGYSMADYGALAPVYKTLFQPAWVIVQFADKDVMEEAWDGAGARFEQASADKPLSVVGVPPKPPAKNDALYRLIYQIRNESALLRFASKRAFDLVNWWRSDSPLFNASRPRQPSIAGNRDFRVVEQLQLLVDALDGKLTVLHVTPFYAPKGDRSPSEVDQHIFDFCHKRAISYVPLGPIYRRLAAGNVAPTGFSNPRPFSGHWSSPAHAAIAEALHLEIKRVLTGNGIL